MSIRQAALRSMVAGAFLWSGVASAQQLANIEVLPAGDFGGFVSVTKVVTIAGVKTPTQVAPTSIKYGKTIGYTVTVRNLGPNHATGVSLAKPTVPAGTKVTGVSGATCDTDAATGDLVFPCLIAADMVNGAPAVTVTVTVTLTALKTAPATCVTDAPFGNVTLSVVTDANTTDTNASTVTIPGAAVTVQNVTDLSITGSVDKATAKVGDTIKYTATVTNKGPCPTAADIDTVAAGTLQLVTGEPAACTDPDDGSATCVTKSLNPGDSVSISRTYKVAKLPEGLQTTDNPYELDVSSDDGFFDPKASDNAAIFTTATDTGAGCSTGGSASLLALVAVAGALYFVRRRRIA